MNRSSVSQDSAPTRAPAWHACDWLALLAIAGSLLVRFWLALDIPLVADEAYYWEWSRRLAFSFYDQGPGVAVYIRAFTAVFGDTQFALKLAAIAAAAISLLCFHASTRWLSFQPWQRLVAVLVVLALPGFFGGAILIMHDSPLMIAWSAALYFTIRYITSGSSPANRSTGFLLAIFVCVGLGALAKHTMVFFALAFALWMLSDRREWALFRVPAFWIGCGISIAILAPIFIWNAQNNWDGVTAILYLRSSLGSKGGVETAASYLVGQLLSFSPLWLLVFMGFALSVLGQRIRRAVANAPGVGRLQTAALRRMIGNFIRNDNANSENPTPPVRRLLWFNALILPLFFLAMSASREIQGNWTFASYLACVLLLIGAARPNAGAGATDSTSPAPRSFGRKLATAIFVIGIVPTLLLDMLAYASVPLAKAAAARGYQIESYFVPGYRPVGFREAIDAVARFRDREAPDAGIVASHRYQDAAIASWHLLNQPEVSSMNVMTRNQYNYWPGLEKGRDYVVFYIHEKTCKRSEVLVEPMLNFMFDEVEAYPEEDVVVDGVTVKRYQLFLARNYRRSWEDMVYNYFVRKSIQDMMPNLRGYFSEVDTSEGQADAMVQLQKMRMARAGGDDCGFLGGL